MLEGIGQEAMGHDDARSIGWVLVLDQAFYMGFIFDRVEFGLFFDGRE